MFSFSCKFRQQALLDGNETFYHFTVILHLHLPRANLFGREIIQPPIFFQRRQRNFLVFGKDRQCAVASAFVVREQLQTDTEREGDGLMARLGIAHIKKRQPAFVERDWSALALMLIVLPCAF